MKNQKALVISIALLLALLCIGSASAAPAKGSQGFAPGEYHPRSWGTPRERELRKLIGKNNRRIRELEAIIKQSKTTRMAPGELGKTHRELNQLRRDNKRYQRELDDLRKKPLGPPRKRPLTGLEKWQQPPRRVRN